MIAELAEFARRIVRTFEADVWKIMERSDKFIKEDQIDKPLLDFPNHPRLTKDAVEG